MLCRVHNVHMYPMFIHGFVVLPVPVTAEVRQAFYLLFFDFVNGIRFRFFILS